MNKNTIVCYAMIMLECRLSVEDASMIFGVDPSELKANLNIENLGSLYSAIKYLFYETSYYAKDNKRGKFKAVIYVRRLRKILGEKNKTKRKEELNSFLDDLSGPSIKFVLENDLTINRYNLLEREKILKYRLKYAVSGQTLKIDFHLDPERIAAWTKELPEGELKERLKILGEYKSDRYYNRLSRRREL